jgi:hypothetical protein
MQGCSAVAPAVWQAGTCWGSAGATTLLLLLVLLLLV